MAAPGSAQGEISKNSRALDAHLDLNGSRVFTFSVHFGPSHARFLRSPFVLQISVPPERCMGWPHMHSVHAGAVQTPFSISALLLKNAFQKTWFWLRFGVTWASDSAKKYKKDIAENEYFEDNAKCWTGAYAHLQGITRCEATPAPKNIFERKTEGRNIKSITFRTSL